MALGFYEAGDLPWPRSYGMAFRRLYENMDIVAADGKLIQPFEPLPHARTEESCSSGRPKSLICDFRISVGMSVNSDVAEDRKQAFPQHAAFIARLVEDLSARLPAFGGYTHTNPDIRRVVSEGFFAMEAELDEKLDETQRAIERPHPSQDEPELWETLNLLLALKDYATAVHAFHSRASAAYRQAAARSGDPDLTRMADAFANCFMTPAADFIQGLLAVNFTWLLDAADSIGRVDQALGPLFEEDIRSGKLDRGFARRLLDEWWRDFERLNGWNMQIGGYTPEGEDGFNALTRECVLACGRNHQRKPNVAFRVTRRTPDDALLEALAVLREGAGRPALYNDDLYVDTLLDMDLGLTPEDAREVGFGGCTETMIAGLSNVGSLEGELNMAKALELALHDGYDPALGRSVGPRTGRFEDFPAFDDFLAAVKRQIQYMTDAFAAKNKRELLERFCRGDPKLNRTMFTRDCVKNGKSFEARGARYNWCVVSYHGIANLIDGLAAVRQRVYEEKSVAPERLLAALAADFEGCETLRRKLESAPRFGNDIEAVDRLASEVMTFAWQALYQHEPPRGGRYIASCILFSTYARAGAGVGATPDGRKAFTPLTDSVGPVQGRDTNGPTAMLNSVLKLPLQLAVGTPVLNIRFQKAILETPDGLAAAAALIRSYFDRGGLQIQLSVISREDMLAAQKDPESYQDLIVRIGGYSEYFTRLSRDLQDSVIQRTEHTTR